MSALELKVVEVQQGEFLLGPLELSLNKGEYLAILGPSGSGKTTLLRAIAGLLHPRSGSISLNSQTLDDNNTHVVPEKRRVGMVFQSLALWPHLTVQQHLEFVLRYSSIPAESRKERAEQFLEKVQLSSKASRKPSELSGGEAQRLALARALIAEPEILLLDEPFGQLDARLRESVLEIILALQQEAKIPILHVTHDPVELFGIAQRFALLQDGKLEQLGTIEKLLNEPANPFVKDFFQPLRRLFEKLEKLRQR